MSYGVYRDITHKALSGSSDDTYLLELLKKDYAGASEEWRGDGGSGVFSHTYDHLDPDDLWDRPVQKSEFNLHVLAQDSADLAVLEEIFAADEDEFRIRKKVNGSVVWTAKVLPGLLKYPTSGYPFVATIVAKDLSHLSGEDFALEDNREKLIETISRNLPYGLDIHTYTSWTEQNTTTSDDFLNQVFHDTIVFRTINNSNSENDEPWTKFRVLEEIAKANKLIIRQENNVWNIFQISALQNPATATRVVYNSSGVKQSSSTVDITDDIDTALYVLPSSMNDYKEAIKKNRLKFNHRSGSAQVEFPVEDGTFYLYPRPVDFDGSTHLVKTQPFSGNGDETIAFSGGYLSTSNSNPAEASIAVADKFLTNDYEWIDGNNYDTDGLLLPFFTFNDSGVNTSTGEITVASSSGADLANGVPVRFYGSGTEPSGLEKGKTYFIIDYNESGGIETFKFSATPGGSAVIPSTTGSGTFTAFDIRLSFDTVVESGGFTTNYKAVVNIETEQIPDDAEGDLEIVLIRETGLADDFWYDMNVFIKNPTQSGLTKSFTLTQSGSYSLTLPEKEVYFGDGPYNYSRASYRYSTTLGDITDGWQFDAAGDVMSHSEIHLKEEMNLRRGARRCLEAELYGTYSTAHVLNYDSSAFFFLGGTQTGYDNRYRAELIEINFETGTDTFEVRVNNTDSSSGASTGGSSAGGSTPTGTYFAVGNNLSEGTPATMRSNLGVAIGTDVQAHSDYLDDIAGLTPSDGAIIVGDGSGFVAESGATARASLGLTIGTHVQAWDAQLDTLSGLSAGQAADLVAITTSEYEQIQNINSVTISNTQWGHVGALDQGLATTDNVQFNIIDVTNRIDFGSTPALEGVIRLSNADSIFWRNAGNSNSIQALEIDSSDIIQIGDSGYSTSVNFNNSITAKDATFSEAITISQTAGAGVILQDSNSASNISAFIDFKDSGGSREGLVGFVGDSSILRIQSDVGSIVLRTEGEEVITATDTGVTFSQDFSGTAGSLSDDFKIERTSNAVKGLWLRQTASSVGDTPRLIFSSDDNGPNTGVGFIGSDNRLEVRTGMEYNSTSGAVIARFDATAGTTLYSDLTLNLGDIETNNFTSGFQGTGHQVTYGGDAEYENLFLRGGLTAYELILNRLRYQDGGVIVGAGGAKVSSVVTSTVGAEVVEFEDPEGNNIIPFTVGAIVLMQDFDLNRTTVIKRIVRKVDAINTVSGKEQITFSDDSDGNTSIGWEADTDDVGTIGAGDEIVAIGHVSDTSLDSFLYMSAVDSNSPFLRIMDGVDSWDAFKLDSGTALRFQIGNMNGTYDYSSTVYGMGAGDPSADYLTVDSTNGVRFIDGADSDKILGQFSSQVFSFGDVTETEDFVKLDNSGGSVSGTAKLSALTADAGTVYIDTETSNGKIALGASASTNTVANTNAGTVIDGDGYFKAYIDADNYIRANASGIVQNFEAGTLKFGNLVLESATPEFRVEDGSSNKIIRIGDFAMPAYNETISDLSADSSNYTNSYSDATSTNNSTTMRINAGTMSSARSAGQNIANIRRTYSFTNKWVRIQFDYQFDGYDNQTLGERAVSAIIQYPFGKIDPWNVDGGGNRSATDSSNETGSIDTGWVYIGDSVNFGYIDMTIYAPTGGLSSSQVHSRCSITNLTIETQDDSVIYTDIANDGFRSYTAGGNEGIDFTSGTNTLKTSGLTIAGAWSFEVNADGDLEIFRNGTLVETFANPDN